MSAASVSIYAGRLFLGTVEAEDTQYRATLADGRDIGLYTSWNAAAAAIHEHLAPAGGPSR